MRTYFVELAGTQPLLMHQDNIRWSEKVKKWQKTPENKKLSVAGDDRSPAWGWLGALYYDNESVTMPSDNIMSVLREGGALVPTGKGQKTFKAQTQSGILTKEVSWPVLVGGEPVPVEALQVLEGEMDFEVHQEVVADLGFELFVKRARIGQAKHIRVRPRFDNWKLEGHLLVLDEQITTEILQSILTQAGLYKGLCDWRPSSRTPGPFGTFTAVIKEV